MQANINQYNAEKFQSRFRNHAIYQQLAIDYDVISFEKYFNGYFFNARTIRESLGARTNNRTVFSAVPFYYLEFLIDKNPTEIYDLGCGWNIFKKYIPNIVGIGAENPHSAYYYADQHDYVDDVFVQGHQNFFESVFSINSLHFVPLSKIQKTVLDFWSMLTPNGRGFLSLNIKRMIEKEPSDRFFNFDPKDYELWVRQQLSNLNIHYAVFDLELDDKNLDESMDGNIRLIIDK